MHFDTRIFTVSNYSTAIFAVFALLCLMSIWPLICGLGHGPAWYGQLIGLVCTGYRCDTRLKSKIISGADRMGRLSDLAAILVNKSALTHQA
jgi:hypothetical protein